MPKLDCPFIKRATELLLINRHWSEKMNYFKRALEEANYPGLHTLSQKELKGLTKRFRDTRIRSLNKIELEKEHESGEVSTGKMKKLKWSRQ